MKFWVLAVLMALLAYRTFEVARSRLPANALARDSRVAIKFDRPSYADAIERTASSVVTIRAMRRIRTRAFRSSPPGLAKCGRIGQRV